MQESNPVKIRAPFNSPYSSKYNGINWTRFDNSQLANQNQDIEYIESESEPEYFSSRSRSRLQSRSRSISRKKKRKFPSQIFRLYSYLKELFLSDSNSQFNIEKFNSNWSIPQLKSAIKTEVNTIDKATAASNYRVKILDLQLSYSDNIIAYSDGLKLSESRAGAGSYISYSLIEQQSYYWHVNSILEAFNIELFAILKSIQQVRAYINSLNSHSIQNIWIFSDNQAAIQRISNNSRSFSQEITYKIQLEAESLLSQNI